MAIYIDLSHTELLTRNGSYLNSKKNYTFLSCLPSSSFFVFCGERGSWGCTFWSLTWSKTLSWTVNWPVRFARGRRGWLCKALSLDACTTTCYIFTVTTMWQQEFRCVQPCLGVKGAGGRHQEKTQMKPLVQNSQLIGLNFWASLRAGGVSNAKPALGAHFNFNHLVRV